jgi:methionyl-tRNA formyltransferase
MLKIGYLASGALGLSTLLATKNYFVPSFIATDFHSEVICKYAIENGIPLFRGNPRKGKLSEFLKHETFDLFLSVNYLFILEPDVIRLAKKAVNFHGSLLPKYRGRTPHVWAIINNESETGVTAHLIDKGCDTGDILFQKVIKIEEDDTGATMLKKFEAIYPELLVEVFKKAEAKTIKGFKQDESISSFFGKRTPDDGHIDWNWQKERIKNWVRAQADPYPGSFTYYLDKKLIIDKVSFSEFAFTHNQPNGLIIQVFPKILVKTPNGVIQLELFRFNQSELNVGEVLK